MIFESFIARRYLSTRNKPLFLWFLTFISLLGMATSVFALIVVSAVMEGFETDFQKRIVGFKSPLAVTGPSETDWEKLAGEISGLDSRIRAVQLTAEGEAVLQTERGEVAGVRIKGITGNPERERFGRVDLEEPMDRRDVLLGNELAGSLGVEPGFFERVRLIFPFGEVGPAGELLPAVKSFTVGGSFRTGFYEYDSKYLLMNYREALRLLGDYARPALELRVEPLAAVAEVQEGLLSHPAMKGLQTTSWREQNPKLFAALKLERIGMFLLLTALLTIASFTIFGLISLTVLEKIRDMAVLRSLGLKGRSVRKIFLLKAAGIGLAGDLTGGIVGLALVSFLEKHPLKLPSTYYVVSLPLQIDPAALLLILILSPLLAVIAALYPAWQSVSRPPAELLRYE